MLVTSLQVVLFLKRLETRGGCANVEVSINWTGKCVFGVSLNSYGLKSNINSVVKLFKSSDKA